MRWRSVHPALGRLQDRFHLVDGATLSRFPVRGAALAGCETLVPQGGGYRAFGALADGDETVSSWSLLLLPACDDP